MSGWAALGGFVGDMLGFHSAERAQDEANFRAQQNIDMQKEFAQHGVTWRVEDATRAGLHPLFALQGSGAAFSPNPIVVDNSQGEALSRAARSAGQTADAWLGQQAALDAQAAATSKDHAIAEYYRSEAARARQATNVSKPALGDVVHQGAPNLPVGPVEGYYDRRKVEPNPTFSRDSNFPSTGAGSSPAFRTYELMPGKLIDLPHTEEGPSEALENLTVTSWPFVIAHNIAHYGADWLKDMASIINPFVESAANRSGRRRDVPDVGRWDH